MPRIRQPIALSVALLGLLLSGGCGDSVINALKNAGLDATIEAIESAGGAAKLIQPGEEVTLAVDSGDIAGASVHIPADALPDDATDSLLSLQPGVVTISPTSQTTVGPVVEINLVRFELDTNVELLTNATVTVPYDITDTSQVTEVVVGHQVASGATSFTVLANATVDQDAETVAGHTRSFSPFVAIVPTPAKSTAQNPLADAVCVIEDDTDSDGNIELKTVYTFNADGKPIKQEQDNDVDGNPDEIKAWSYDANGLYTLVKNDFDGDGTFDSESTITSHTDANGKITGTTKNGFIREFVYASDGTTIEKIQFSDGNQEIVTTDSDGNVTSVGFDAGSDGSISECDTFSHSGGALTTGESRDGTCTNGMVDRERTFSDCPSAAAFEVFVLLP